MAKYRQPSLPEVAAQIYGELQSRPWSMTLAREIRRMARRNGYTLDQVYVTIGGQWEDDEVVDLLS